jgi:hypothetical protein
MDLFYTVALVRGKIINSINTECHGVYEFKYLNVLPKLSVLHHLF